MPTELQSIVGSPAYSPRQIRIPCVECEAGEAVFEIEGVDGLQITYKCRACGHTAALTLDP